MTRRTLILSEMIMVLALALLAGACVAKDHGAASKSGPLAQASGDLFSPQDADALRLDDAEWEHAALASKALGPVVGPVIQVEVPQLVETDSGPIVAVSTRATIVVRFVENKAPVAMDTLEVVARKGWFSKTLTDKLAPYIVGTTLQANDIKIPSGKFQFEISISDAEGRATESTYRFEVSE